MKKSFRFYSDPGHGWLAVKRKLLVELGILERISRYSYQRGGTVYLEEDCDAVIFTNAFYERTGASPDYVSIYHEKTPIRSYEAFSPT